MKKTSLVLLSLVWFLPPVASWAAKKTTTTTSIITTTTTSVASTTTTSAASSITTSAASTTSTVASSTTTTAPSTSTSVASSTTTTASATTTTPFSPGTHSMAEYTCYPIFTANTVKPNILILLDNSGNMNMMAYGYDAEGYYHPNDYDPNITYYGYFNSTKKYTYAGEFDMNPAGTWNGNFLNWLTMRRVDVMRKVLVGGLATSRTGGGNTKLYADTPSSDQDHHKFFKFDANSGSYSPYNGTYVFKISKGYIEVYRIDTPANFDHDADFKMYCNDFDGHDAQFEDMEFKYTGAINKDGKSYNVHPRKASEPSGACNYNAYNETTTLTTLTYVTSLLIKVDKSVAEEPEAFVNGNIAGIMQKIDEKARFGTAWFNKDGSKYELGGGVKDGATMAKYIGGELTSMITTIENQPCDTYTPLAEGLFEVVNYYRQVAPYYAPGDYSGHDPFDYPGTECGNNFVLIVTSGQSTMDRNIPSWLQDYDGDGNDTDFSEYPHYGSDYLDDVALWANTNDMRPDDVDGFNNVITYVVYAFGEESPQLIDTAKNGGFIDRNGNKRPDLNSEWDANGDGIPDNYFAASQGSNLEAKILEAITAMLQRAASGTAVSLLSTSAEGEGSLFQAFFKPRVVDGLRQVKWLGYLNALWVDPYGNMREDTNQDNALVYDEDNIIKFEIDSVTGDTAIKRYRDSDGDGRADVVAPATEPVPFETALLEEMEPQWEAGKILAQRNASTRTIKTWIDPNGNGAVDAGEVIDFTSANASRLRPFLDVDTVDEAEDLINFIRGEEVTNHRDRNITIGGSQYVWKLGDIVYSTPTVVGKPMEMYNLYYSDVSYSEFYSLWKNRGVTVYVGANDGMLHAFKAGTFHEGDNPSTLDEEHGWYSTTEDPATSGDLGDERWSFIPFNLLPHLRWLREPEYTHVFYVDLKPKVTDVRIFNDDSNHPNGWGTILIGGMRLGGGEYTLSEDFDGDGMVEAVEGSPGKPTPWAFHSAYFVLDITVPNNPVFLGEFTDDDLNFTTSYPAISRVEAVKGFQNPEDDEWYVIVGSGPTSCDGAGAANAYLMIYDLNTMQQVQKTVTAEGDAFMADPITIDINLNYNTELVYIGETYDAGTLGKMYRLSPCNSDDPAVFSFKHNPAVDPWPMTSLFSSPRPITSSPTASLDEDENVWVYFGTGKYMSEADKTDTTQQYFFGIKDPCQWGNCDPVADEILMADLYNSTNITVLTNKEVEGAASNNWDEFVDEVQAKDGWYYTLDVSGERVLNRPSILGGVVLTAPFIPDGDICGFGGTGSLYAFYYETGSAYFEPILGTNPHGDDEESIVRIELDKGITSAIGLHVGKKVESTGFIQQGSGEVIQVEVDPALGVKSGLVGWQQY